MTVRTPFFPFHNLILPQRRKDAKAAIMERQTRIEGSSTGEVCGLLYSMTSRRCILSDFNARKPRKSFSRPSRRYQELGFLFAKMLDPNALHILSTEMTL